MKKKDKDDVAPGQLVINDRSEIVDFEQLNIPRFWHINDGKNTAQGGFPCKKENTK